MLFFVLFYKVCRKATLVVLLSCSSTCRKQRNQPPWFNSKHDQPDKGRNVICKSNRIADPKTLPENASHGHFCPGGPQWSLQWVGLLTLQREPNQMSDELVFVKKKTVVVGFYNTYTIAKEGRGVYIQSPVVQILWGNSERPAEILQKR